MFFLSSPAIYILQRGVSRSKVLMLGGNLSFRDLWFRGNTFPLLVVILLLDSKVFVSVLFELLRLNTPPDALNATMT